MDTRERDLRAVRAPATSNVFAYRVERREPGLRAARSSTRPGATAVRGALLLFKLTLDVAQQPPGGARGS